ncbi:MAG: MG2 domain-containing protein [Vicinamibacteria bacterium]
MRLDFRAVSIFALLLAPAAAGADLSVVSIAPQGVVASLEQAGEVRVLFSEPMVPVGPAPGAPFFRLEPALPGSLRWAGSDTLVFTPRQPLPRSTRFQVTIEAGATAVSGARLARAVVGSFTTPTLSIERARWYRRSGRFDSPLLIELRFNQPVKAEDVLPQLALSYASHPFLGPVLGDRAKLHLLRLDERAVADFEAKLVRTRAVAEAGGRLELAPAREWDRERFPEDEQAIVLEIGEAPAPEAWLNARLGPAAHGSEGTAGRGSAQDQLIKLEPAFFVNGPRCALACDPGDWNPIGFSLMVRVAALQGRLRVYDVTDPGPPQPLQPKPVEREGDDGWTPDYGDGYDFDRASSVALEDVGFSLRPARSYLVTVARDVVSADGQTLGYTWAGLVENWHRRAFTSFGSGHGVWEAGGGPLLPYSIRNLRSVVEYAAPLTQDALVPALRELEEKNFELKPPGAARTRRLTPTPDALQALGLDLAPQLGPARTGLVWAGLQEGEPIPRAPRRQDAGVPRSTLVQVTNLGLTVKDSPLNTFMLVTRLDTGAPVAGARVALRSLDNVVLWQGATNASGLAIAPSLPLRPDDQYWKLSYVATAEKDGDVAYLTSRWHEGLEPWYWGIDYDSSEAKPILRGSVFPDRGVYKPGEEVRLKAILRSDTNLGMKLLPPATVAEVTVIDTQATEIDKRKLTLGEWGGADWTLKLPDDGPLGTYAITLTVEGQNRAIDGQFLVAAYRRPDFRVDANLASETSVAGSTLKGLVDARYLFGAPMAKRPVSWTLARQPLFEVPTPIADAFPAERWAFLDLETDEQGAELSRAAAERVDGKAAELDAQGRLALELPTDPGLGRPYLYTLEGEVTDVSRQALAGRASFRVDPAPFYLGLRQPPFFAQAGGSLDTELIAAGLDGLPRPGVAVSVQLVRVQWTSVRRAEGQGFYTWESQRKELPAGEWSVTTAAAPAPLSLPLEQGGFYVLRAKASAEGGRTTTSAVSFYVLGAGYTAWARHDHNRIELVPEKKAWRPGDTARVLVKSPWEKATALVTTEREGVRAYQVFELGSTQQTVSVPILERDVPNVYVSVLLIKGRSAPFSAEDSSDPGKPAFRVGYAELEVEDASKRLDVTLSSDREEYRPGARARIELRVADRRRQPVSAEVTLWAVDYGVLSLTGYRTPDVRRSVWADKALQVLTQDSRLNVISRRVLADSKGEAQGGGGGLEFGPGLLRRDFRPLAFWLGSVVTDAQGRATREVELPDSLTTYRIMAVAGDKASRFGSAEREIRTSKPVLLRPTLTRFLTPGDRALVGAVVVNQLAQGGAAIVTLRSLDPAVVELTQDPELTLELPPRGQAEARFGVRAKAPGVARVQVSVRLHGERDAFEETLPVRVAEQAIAVAAYGEAKPRAQEAFELPRDARPEAGGLTLELASSALVGLGEGARYLVEYPYGCAEQRASATLALATAAELGSAFRLEGLEGGKLAAAARSAVEELASFQCGDGSFAFWKGACQGSSPYVSAYVLRVLAAARAAGQEVPPEVLERGYDALEASLLSAAPADAGPRLVRHASQALAASVLAEAGRNVDSALTRLYAEADRLPVFALAHLLEAVGARGERGPRRDDLQRRLSNAILIEGSAARASEADDPALAWLWSSSVRTSALALRALVRASAAPELQPRLVRGLLDARRQGRFGNTQENAAALEALSAYYRAHEAETPDFSALVSLGAQTIARADFRRRGAEAAVSQLSLSDLRQRSAAGERLPLEFAVEGTGTLHYGVRLRYLPAASDLPPAESGFSLARSYALAREDGSAAGTAPALAFKAGDLVRVTLALRLPKERRFVALRDPLPAGFEPVEAWFDTTAARLAREVEAGTEGEPADWLTRYRRGGFDHVERRDDQVLAFATRLGEGEHVFSYLVRATSAGSFRAAAAGVEEMYAPEVFGRTGAALLEVRP